jgi:succinyl-CoA synthetase alpha subunit
VRKGQYYDSVFLMRIASLLGAEPGVRQAAAVMATPANKELLAEVGLVGGALDTAGPNDLAVGVIADDPAVVERLLASLDERLQGAASTSRPADYRSIGEAAAANPQSNLVVISVPGEYAAREARLALEQGKHAFVFSSNVPVEQEVELKQLARERGLLVMGPDCGTSLLAGHGIGFANVVRRGPIGVLGASGTGIQEFTSLVHRAGSGISHAIGTGSHDLSEAVGAVTSLMAFDALEADPTTRLIAIVSKPGEPGGLAKLQARIAMSKKPVVGCFLGLERQLDGLGTHFHQANTIDEAVASALQFGANGHQPATPLPSQAATHAPTRPAPTTHERRWGARPEQRYLRGIFAGGTFCYQAQQVLRQAGIAVYSNAPLDKRYRLENATVSLEHTLVDMGDDEFTRGKPHPMIDATQRRKRILAEAEDPAVAILLVDFILGHMAAPDPVGDLIGALRTAMEKAAARGGALTVVASVCGTDQDPQGLDRQRALLEQAGVRVHASNAAAAHDCAGLLAVLPGGVHGR